MQRGLVSFMNDDAGHQKKEKASVRWDISTRHSGPRFFWFYSKKIEPPRTALKEIFGSLSTKAHDSSGVKSGQQLCLISMEQYSGPDLARTRSGV